MSFGKTAPDTHFKDSICYKSIFMVNVFFVFANFYLKTLSFSSLSYYTYTKHTIQVDLTQ